MRMGNIPNPSEYRPDCAIDRIRMLIVRPEVFQTIFVQKHRREVGLGVQVNSQGLDAMVGKHPGQVVNERGFSNPSLVIEESDGLHAGLRKILTSTLCS